MGRFLSKAPFAPHIEHPYVYVSSKPTKYADPLGKQEMILDPYPGIYTNPDLDFSTFLSDLGTAMGHVENFACHFRDCFAASFGDINLLALHCASCSTCLAGCGATFGALCLTCAPMCGSCTLRISIGLPSFRD